MNRGPHMVAHMCRDPLSRCTCRARVTADFLRKSWGFSGVAAVSRYTPPPKRLSHLQLSGVSHVKLPLKRCRATWGCSSYTCRCRATLCNYGPTWVYRPVRGRDVNWPFFRGRKRHINIWHIPPPREKITKIIRPEYFYVILGGGYGKIT